MNFYDLPRSMQPISVHHLLALKILINSSIVIFVPYFIIKTTSFSYCMDLITFCKKYFWSSKIFLWMRALLKLRLYSLTSNRYKHVISLACLLLILVMFSLKNRFFVDYESQWLINDKWKWKYANIFGWIEIRKLSFKYNNTLILQ